MQKRHRVWILAAMGAAVAAGGCTTFSSYQSAKLLPAGDTSVTAALSGARFSEDVADDDASDQTLEIGEVMVRHGISETIEVGGRYARLGLESDGTNVLLADIKRALTPGKLALSVPVGLVFADGEVNFYQIQPALLGRIELSPNAALELAGKTILILATDSGETDSELLLGANIGLRVGPADQRFAIHPELGVLANPGEEGVFYQLGVGVSFTP
jgi:hypothetical protein